MYLRGHKNNYYCFKHYKLSMNLQFLPVVYLGGWKKKTNTAANTEWENLAGQGNKIINKRIQSDHCFQPVTTYNPFSLPSTSE